MWEVRGEGETGETINYYPLYGRVYLKILEIYQHLLQKTRPY
ncbi:hypothetical protein [Hydrococcus rivularis]|nr:hypothetical protein [Hydrococcus rivularis]